MKKRDRTKPRDVDSLLNDALEGRSEGVKKQETSAAIRSAVEDISVNDERPSVKKCDDPPEPEHPEYVWVKFAPEQAPPDGLDYRADGPFPTSINGPSTGEPVGKQPGKPTPAANKSSSKEPLHPALHALAEFVRDVVQQTTAPREADWVDQHESPLGKRRHLELVRAGVLPGSKRGRRVFVRRTDIEAFIAGGLVAPATPKSKKNDVDDDLRALGFEVPDDET